MQPFGDTSSIESLPESEVVIFTFERHGARVCHEPFNLLSELMSHLAFPGVRQQLPSFLHITCVHALVFAENFDISHPTPVL